MLKIVLSTAVAIGLGAGAANAADKAALVEEGKALMKQFGSALKSELLTAVEEKGAPEAITVCSVKAPEIAARISAASGWSVARSSHKLRNPGNEPDSYTAAAIEDFLSRQANGEKADDLAKAEIVEDENGRSFRLVKAIPTAKLCLNCHGGDEVKPAVADRLAELYPKDRARGFKVGEMRGVFTLTKPLD